MNLFKIPVYYSYCLSPFVLKYLGPVGEKKNFKRTLYVLLIFLVDIVGYIELAA